MTTADTVSTDEGATDATGPAGPATEAAPETQLFTIEQFPEKLAMVRLGPGAEIPPWAESSSIFSITATATETSIVCAGRSVPTKVPAHRGYLAFAVVGPLEPSLIGVLAELLAPLAAERISVLTLSTYDTDWVLVPAPDAERAAEAWRRKGHTVAAAVPR